VNKKLIFALETCYLLNASDRDISCTTYLGSLGVAAPNINNPISCHDAQGVKASTTAVAVNDTLH